MIARNLLLADAVDVGPSGKLFIHGGGIGRVFASHFPWAQPGLGVVGTIELEEHEPGGKDHEVAIEFLDASGAPLGAGVTSIFRPGAPEDPELPASVNLALMFQGLVFPEPGRYWVAVSVDGEELRRLAFAVRLRSE